MTKPVSLRKEMPETAAFIDAIRSVFGKEMVNDAIRAGIGGAGTFYASENGTEIGSRPAPAGLSLDYEHLNIAEKKESRK